MLALQLKSGEYLTIGDDVVVQIFQQPGSSFRVEIKAPREVSGGAWGWRCFGTTPPCGPSLWSPVLAGWCSIRTAPSRSRPARQ